MRARSANAAAGFSATVAYEYDAYNWSARAWARTTDSHSGIVAYGQWTPAEIETALWLDAADSSTITETGGAVSVWADKSGNGRDVAQNTPRHRPVIGIELVNGLNVLSFGQLHDSGYAYLDGGSAHHSIGTGNLSVFVVARSDKGSTGNVISKADTDTSGGRWALVAEAGGFVTGPNNTQPGGLSDTGLYTSFGLGLLRIDGNESQQLWNNGLLSDSAALSWGSYDLTTSKPFWVGSYNNGGLTNNSHVGVIAEVLILHSAVDDLTRQKTEGYLAHKWGLTANLPADHPYKSVAP